LIFPPEGAPTFTPGATFTFGPISRGPVGPGATLAELAAGATLADAEGSTAALPDMAGSTGALPFPAGTETGVSSIGARGRSAITSSTRSPSSASPPSAAVARPRGAAGFSLLATGSCDDTGACDDGKSASAIGATAGSCAHGLALASGASTTASALATNRAVRPPTVRGPVLGGGGRSLGVFKTVAISTLGTSPSDGTVTLGVCTGTGATYARALPAPREGSITCTGAVICSFSTSTAFSPSKAASSFSSSPRR
jgi:hypothetical protein